MSYSRYCNLTQCFSIESILEALHGEAQQPQLSQIVPNVVLH